MTGSVTSEINLIRLSADHGETFLFAARVPLNRLSELATSSRMLLSSLLN